MADPSIPVSTIANRVELSRNAVRQRIKLMERDNVIFWHMIKFSDAKPPTDRTVAIILNDCKHLHRGAYDTSAIRQYAESKFCVVLSCKFDLSVQIKFESLAGGKEICGEI